MPGASAEIDVVGVDAPSVTRSFRSAADGGSSVFVGASVDLVYTITNNFAGAALSDVTFSDDISAIAGGITASVGSGTPCGSGSRLQAVGGSILLLDGAIAQGGSCTFAVRLDLPDSLPAGGYPAAALSLSASSLGAPLTAIGAAPTLTVEPTPTVSATFSPATVSQDDVSTWTLSIDNSNAVIASPVAVSGAFPTGLTVAAVPNATSTCSLSGPWSVAAGAPAPGVPATTVSAGGTCTIALDLLATDPGTLTYAPTVTVGAGASAAAGASLVVLDNVPPDGYAASFVPAIVNAANANAVDVSVTGAELGATVSWEITSDAGGTPVIGSTTAATADLTLSGLDLSGLGDGTLTLSLRLTDAGNNAGAIVTDTIAKDVTGAAVVLSGPDTAQSDPFQITATFADPVSGLEPSDFTITNGTLSGLTPSGIVAPAAEAVYTATVTPDHDGTVVIALPQGAATDATGNPSVAATPLEVTADLTGTPNPTPPADNDGDGVPDFLESSTADRDGDGIPDAQDYDPQGYFYCEDDGRILPGGGITVTGPSGSNSSVGTSNDIRIVADGTTGEYQWFAQIPGTFTVVYDYPTALGVPSTTRTVSGGALDVTSLLPDNPAVLGSTEFGSTGALADGSLAGNPVYYDTFVIEAGDPHVLANNIPLSLCGENPVTVAIVDIFEFEAQTVLTVSMQRESTVDTVITYSLSGTATPGIDYTAPSGTVTIPAGEVSADVVIDVTEDTDIEGDETLIVTLDAVASGDATTVLGAPADITDTATITDDDLAEVGVTYVDMIASESGDTARMDFFLLAPPTAPVTLDFAGDGQCTVSPATMTFTAGDYTSPQSLRIEAIDDDRAEGDHTCTPVVGVSSADARFDGIDVTLAAVTITDDLVDQVREQLTEILERDVKEAVQTQSRRFSGIARGARDR
ncbi:Ig-like domain-containing protein, partial [Citreimonas sp.]|uniref:DUF7933 domain-containing protein n=1 Tax=Citreimonas sp. TaxID=3036715 RepID=UPI0035C8716A